MAGTLLQPGDVPMKRTYLLLAASALAGCMDIGDGSGEAKVDGGRDGDGDNVALPDSSPPPATSDADAGTTDAGTPALSDAAVGSEPDPEPIPATVTASCLFLRQGPGTDTPKVDCIPGRPECNADNDVCMPMGDTFEVTGGPASGAGCTEWYAGTYKEYA